MAKLRRTLLIGLGGTGFNAILNAKKMFYENYGEIPPMIGFIGRYGPFRSAECICYRQGRYEDKPEQFGTVADKRG